MHRHGYKGRKFNRERDQREALLHSLAESLIIHESIETTLTKAKEIVPIVEKLITKSKIGDLHNRRQIISSLQQIGTAHKLIDEIAPKLGKRSSGHLRVERTRLRHGDNAQLARVSFVDDLKEVPVTTAAKSSESRDVSKKAQPIKTQNSKLKTRNSKPEAKK